MTIADDPQNPKPAKKLAKSMDAIAALRHAMEQRLNESTAPETGSAEPPASEKTAPAPAADAQTAPSPGPAPAPETAPSPGLPPQTPDFTAYDPAEWTRILMRIAERSQKLIFDYIARAGSLPMKNAGLDMSRYGLVFAELANKVLNDPQRFVDAQIALWQGYVKIWQSALARMQGQAVDDPVKPSPGDRRFADHEWQSNWLFDVLKQLYLLTAAQMKKIAEDEGRKLPLKMARKLEFITRQMVDAASPSNFWMTNPEVLRAIYKTGGESLIKGLENLLADLESGKGELRIRMTDFSAFRLGQNIATTPGQVIFQNDLIQLIQYAPQTAETRRVPLLILPPWINKYYILDLRPKNSFIGWLVAQGYTVFCVSWVNPDKTFADVTFDDYMTDGALAAMREVKRATGCDDINMLGYCIGGTLLASTLAYLKAVDPRPADLPQVASATYLVTLTDFSEPGDLGNFMDEEMISFAEEKMQQQGYMDGASMGTVFNLLRANDLVWSYVVHNYLLGKDPTPFDILYWNSDCTNMPAAMQRYYIREMYMANNLVKPGALSFKNVPIDLTRIDTPTFMLSTRDDHIAPWTSTYAATRYYKGPVRFVLASSGHIAGVINPPASGKYGYWTNASCPAAPGDWFKGATAHQGSWWPEWETWLRGFGGDTVPARTINGGLEPAPGSYVKVRAV